MTEYRYIIADVLTDAILGELPLSGVQYGPELNGHNGACNGTVPTILDVVTPELISPGRTALYVERDGELRWGGIVWTLTPRGQTLGIGAEGHISYFSHRHIRDGLDHGGRSFHYVGIDPLWIVRNLIDYAQSKVNGDIGIIVGDETSPVRIGTAEEPVDYPWWENNEILEAIATLAESDNGFDYRIDVSYGSDGGIEKRLRLGYPKLGTRHHTLAFATGVNVKTQVEPEADGTKLQTLHDAFGAGEGRNMRRSTAEIIRDGTPRLEGSSTYKLVKSNSRLDTLARTGLRAGQATTSVPSIVLRPHPTWRFGDFDAGDELYCSLHEGYSNFDGWARIVAFTVEPEESEQVTVMLDDAALFVYGQGEGDPDSIGVPP